MSFPIISRARDVLTFALIVFAAVVVTGCSSSSDDAVAVVPPPTPGPTITGNVTAPAGLVVMLQNQSFRYALLETVFPSVRADIIGLQPVGGATVELIRVDNSGVQVGAVLASTSTSITGDYTLELPAGVDFAANLVVRITGTGVATLEAQVVEQVVDINPITSFVLDKLVEGGTQLDTLAVGEVVRLRGSAEEFDLTAGADLTEMLAVLDAEVGGFLEDEVAAVNATPGDGAGAAGDYNEGLFSVGLQNFDMLDGTGWRNGNFNAEVDISTLTIADTGNGTLTAMFNGGEQTSAWLGISNNVPPDTFLSTFTDIEQADTELFPLTIDDNSVIRFNEPFEEEIILEAAGGGPGGTGIRTPPTSGAVYPAGPDNDLFVINETFTDVFFNLTDTDDDGINDALDPNAQTGTGAFIDFEFLARVPVTFPSLDGNWGFVSLEVGLSGNGNIFAGVCLDAVTISGTNTALASTTSSCQDVDRAVGAVGGLALVEDTATFAAVLTPGSNGLITAQEAGDPTVANGFVDADGDFMALFFAEDVDDGGNPATLTNLERGAFFGVPLGSTTPDLTGRNYRLLSQEIWFDSTGPISLSRISDATLTFDSNVSATLSPHATRSAVRESDFAGPVSVNEETAISETAGVTLAADGAITATLTDGTVVEGYVSADRNLLLMRYTYASGGDVEMGLIVGVPATP